MAADSSASEGQFVHVVPLDRKDAEHATRCIEALAGRGRPDALAFNGISYDPGIEEDAADKVYIIELWRRLHRTAEGRASMPAYLIAEHVITDPAKFEEYRTKVAPMIAKHGGRYLTKGGSHKLPEGGHWKPERVVIIEFPDIESLDRWYGSPEYQPLIALRKACTSDLDMLITLEGV